MTDGNRCIHGYELACRVCSAAGNWPPKRHPAMPKPCLIRWNPRTQLWHGTAFGFQSNGHTVASVYANLDAMLRRWHACFAYTVIGGGTIKAPPPSPYTIFHNKIGTVIEDSNHGL
jgi:hypothetical protein